jgi:Arc/MetJ family transcription regulator
MTMTSTTKTFLIIARASGGNMGLFEATSEDDAVEQMIRAAGYRDAQDEAEVLQSTPEKLRAELSVFPVDVPAIVAKLADAMVTQDRESHDCADVRDNADAVAVCGWDRLGIVGLVDDLSLGHEGDDREVARAIWEYSFSELREAYAKAWREAVEADLAEREAEAEALAERQWETGYDAALTDLRQGRADGPCKARRPEDGPFYNGICENYAEGYNAALAEAAEEAEAD